MTIKDFLNPFKDWSLEIQCTSVLVMDVWKTLTEFYGYEPSNTPQDTIICQKLVD